MFCLSFNKWKILFSILAFSIILYLSHSMWLPLFGKFLVVRDNLEKSDVIIVLGTHPKGARVKWATTLYKRGLAKNILMCGYKAGWKTSTGDIMKNQAVYLSIAEDAIIVDHGDYNTGTWDNAFTALKLSQEKNF